MKIRILGNSIRLRLSQSDVKSLAEKKYVEEKTYFGSTEESVFIYSLEIKDTNEIRAIISANHIQVFIPNKIADNWANSDEISLENYMSIGRGLALRILIEKDFKCGTERGEDESDLFPNPAESC
ncbi:MAG: hypothetical protein AAFZ15_28575 [Bacteroidota bacterium]